MDSKFQNYLKLNKNILIAFSFDFVISALVAQSLSNQENYLNATITLFADHGTFLSVLGILLFLDNRAYYVNSPGKINWGLLKIDLIKIITSLGLAEIIYSIIRWYFQYYFLSINYEAFFSSILGQLIAVPIYLVCVNFLVKITKWSRFSKKPD